MANFNNRSGAGDKGRSGGRRSKNSFREASEKKEGKNSYKAKRSFSKNKSFRENKAGRPEERTRRTFKTEGSKSGEERSFTKKPQRREEYHNRKSSGGFRERAERDRENKSERFGRSEEGDKTREKKRSAAYPDKKRSSDKSGRGEKDSSKRVNYRSFEEGSAFSRDRDEFKEKRSSQSREKKEYSDKAGSQDKPKRWREEKDNSGRVKHREFKKGNDFSPGREQSREKRAKKPGPVAKQPHSEGLIRLNKYLSNAGVASRREADNLILSGAVKVNGIVVDQLGTKVRPTDKITYGDAAVKAERKVYLLLNKPKDYITTVDDPRERKTVMELLQGACKERIYPVGRLDRNTTGLLLFTNDGELTTKLTHPKFGIKKVYHVSLNKGLKAEDFKAIVEGIELEDGLIKADDLAFVGEGKKEIGIEIHSGRNRIVRRIFEHLGYDVLKLDRVVFAGLTKKDLPRGKYRFLTGKEVGYLQMIG